MNNNIKLPNFDDYLIEYFNKWKDINYTTVGFMEYIVKIIHFILILFVLIGPFLPYQIIPYHIVCLLLLIISWKIFDGCLLSVIFNKKDFIPLSKGRAKQIIFIILLIEIFNYSNPQYSLFNITNKVISHLNNYYN
ncbi:hypothetical protein QKU48_gp0607 [Fadolivirus algeromassiliense]|jgi:hypothetical protein|uniref:Uncharacterized protein n=1 Tax=Fadolivirus FV1/VV64 TaxID=3070911 RepID=A0A7D3QUE1_9VIRU|nr:hypothetical protein QKU48_gp0607 [Fadolivirus algeromassiliense]QKF94065.1 hypothetical protein Fadolivirus_1_607 [Fadolivirus FV1/VV64]